MADKKKILGLCSVLAAVAILIILLLRGCMGTPVDSPTEPTQTGPATSATDTADTIHTDPAEETTEATEETSETTEATEETEPEETQGPSGSDTPGGYNPGFGEDDEDEDEKEETKPFEAPAAGVENNPYVEKLPSIPGEISTVLIPLEGSVYYEIHGAANSVLMLDNPDATVIYGETACKPDENGLISLSVGEGTDPITIQLSNAAAAEVPYLLKFIGPVGSESNPQVLESIEEIVVELAEGDADGHYYSWIVTETGELTLQPQAEGYVITVTIGDTTISSADSEDGSLTFEIEENQEVIIHVIAESAEEDVYPAVTDTILGTLSDKGTLLNPYVRHLTELPAEITTVEIPLDSYRVYDIYGAGETVLTINDPDAVIVYNSTTFTADESGILTIGFDILEPETAARLAISCSGEEAKAFTMHFAYPEGSEKNPIVLEALDPVSLTLAGGDDFVRWCSWTAEKTGTVTVQIDSVNPETAACGISLTAQEDTAAAELPQTNASISVEAGQTVLIRVEALADEEGNYPAAEVTISGSFQLKQGLEENPILLAPPEGTITVAAGESLYCTVQVPGMNMTLTGENVSVLFMETEYTAEGGQICIPMGDEETQTFVVTNHGQAEAVYSIYFDYPLGSEENPALLILGENTAKPENGEGYAFAWTMETGGQLTITAAEGTAWTYSIENRTNAEAATVTGSEASQMVEAAAGDELRIIISGEAAEITFTASFFDPTLGTAVNPIRLKMPEDEITLAPSETVYYRAAAAGADMTLEGTGVSVVMGEESFTLEEGILTFRCKASEGETDVVFAFTNAGEKEGIFRISFAYPVGGVQNPDELLLGENTATVEPGSDGYYYSWMALTGGELTLTATEGTAWNCRVTNLTAESAEPSEGTELSRTVAVEEGDELLIRITALNPENPEARPGGELVFTASFFDPTLGTEANPIVMNVPQDTVTVAAGETRYYQARVGGMTLTLTGESVTVSHDGRDYTPESGKVVLSCADAGAFAVPVFAVTNTGTAEASYAVSFTWPEGHRENPVGLELGEVSCTVEAGTEGCFYTWTAEADGILTITMAEDSSWLLCLNNLTAELYGDIQTSDDEAPVMTISVKAGDTVQLQINTYDPTAPNTAPAGTVSFSASFQIAEK